MFHREFENDENEKNNPLTITLLPPELIELFSVYLDMNSFLSMRFTCQLFCSSLERELSRRIKISKPKQIAFSSGHLIVLHEDGTVSEDKIDTNDPKSISNCNRKRLSNLPKIVQVAANNQNRFYLDVDGNVWLAKNSYTNIIGGMKIHIKAHPPTLLSNASNVTHLAVTERGAMFLKSDGTLLAYGSLNSNTQSGEQPNFFKGTQLEELKAISGDICQIELTSVGSFFLKKDGTVWERREYSGSRAKVTQIPELTGIVEMFIGRHNYFFLKEDHSFWGYGANPFGSLGVGHDKPISAPTLLSNVPNIHEVYPGHACYTFFITEDASLLYSGLDVLKKSNIPTPIPMLSGVKQVLDVSHPRHELTDLILLLMNDGRILSVESKEKLLELRNSSNISDKISCMNKWFKIHKKFSSKSRFFHQSNSHETLETQKEATNLTINKH